MLTWDDLAENRLHLLHLVQKKFCITRDDAEDVVSETFIKAYSHRVGFDGANLISWLFVIARNHFLQGKRRANRIIFTDELPETSVPPHQEKQHALYESLEVMTWMSPNMRQALIASVRGQSYEEIALAQGVAVGTVKSRVFRAHTILREFL